jgi:hypothetical protein
VSNRREMMLRLTHTVAGLPVEDPLPLRMCAAFVQIVEAEAGSITVGYASSERTLLCATDETSARYEDAQDFVREGPSLDAFRTGRVVASLSVEDQRHRWPGLASSLLEPFGAVRAIPMRPGTGVMGVLTVHDGRDMMDDEVELTFLADAIGTAILGDLPENDDVSRLWSERDRVSQATGMIVAQLGIAPADALALLRAHAFAHESTVVEVSRRVVDRKLDFSGPDRGEAS